MIINKISIIVPAFNEESTISIIADKLLNLYLVNNIKKEIIIVLMTALQTILSI